VGFVIPFPYIFFLQAGLAAVTSVACCCYICGLLPLGSGKKKDFKIFHGSSFS